MSPFVFLFADAGWVGLAAFIIFIVFSIVSKAVSQFQEMQKEAMRRARANPQKPAPRPADSLEDEIAEFLRRASERQKPGRAERPKPAQAERPPAPPPPVTEGPTRPFRPPLRPAAEPVEPEVVAVPVEQETVAEHVKDRFGRPRLGTVGSTGLGREVAEADEKADERFRRKFGHEVGRLGAATAEAAMAAALAEPSMPTRTTAAPALDAGALAALLTNPATLRQTILVSEILRRPEERWG